MGVRAGKSNCHQMFLFECRLYADLRQLLLDDVVKICGCKQTPLTLLVLECDFMAPPCIVVLHSTDDFILIKIRSQQLDPFCSSLNDSLSHPSTPQINIVKSFIFVT
jgi:hypothetical protein